MPRPEIDLSKIKAFPPYRKYNPNLDAYFNYVTFKIMSNLAQGRKSRVSFIGPPGSGKTELMGIFENRLETVIPSVRSVLKEVTFEKHGRDPAMAAGLLNTDPTIDRTKEEIEIMSSFVTPTMREIAVDPNVLVEIDELPFMTQLEVDGGFVGLDAGSRALYEQWRPELFQDEIEGPFFDPDTENFAVFPRSGLHLRYYTRHYRTMAKGTKTLEERQQVAIDFNKPIPQTEEEGLKMVIDGAVARTMDLYMYWMLDPVSHPLARRARRLVPTSLGGFEERARIIGRNISSNVITPSASRIREGAIARHLTLTTFKDNPHIPEENIFMGDNNPPQSVLYAA